VLLTRSFVSRSERRQSGGLSPLNALFIQKQQWSTACTVSPAKSTHEQMTVTCIFVISVLQSSPVNQAKILTTCREWRSHIHTSNS